MWPFIIINGILFIVAVKNRNKRRPFSEFRYDTDASKAIRKIDIEVRRIE